jgi:hypothetical protein
MPKQSQSQRQSVVVNIGTSKTKSKPRKSRGRGGLPPPSYQHNLAPTFVTQQATDYNPVIGAIASLTSRLQQEPRIQQPVTPLSSATQMATPSQSAEQMAGEKAEERRAGQTAGNFQPLPSQADERLSMSMEDRPPAGNLQPLPSQADERLSMSMEDRPPPTGPREADEYTTERLVKSTEGGGGPAGGGGSPRELISSPEALERSRQQTRERKERLDSIREKIKRGEGVTTEEVEFVNKSKGTKKIQKSLDIVD